MPKEMTIIPEPLLRQQYKSQNLGQLVGALKLTQYFKKIDGHTLILENMPNDSAYFCSDMTFYNPVPTEVVNISMEEISAPKLFYEFLNSGIYAGVDYSCRQYVLNGKPVAYYNPETNTLIASNWFHDSNAISSATLLWEVISKDIKKKFERPNIDITLGADPEFEYVRGSEVVSAGSALLAEHRNTHTRLGMDGASGPVEFRPKPTTNAEDMIEDIRKIMETFYKAYGDELSVVGDNIAVGCHIHFGLGQSINPPKTLLQLLDIALFNPLYNFNGRARGGYLKNSAYESKSWGFEYRSLPSGVLYEPKFATLVFKVAQNIVQKYASGVSFKFMSETQNSITVPSKQFYLDYGGLNDEEYTQFVDGIRMYVTDKKSAGFNCLNRWVDKVKIRPYIRYGMVIMRDQWENSVQRALQLKIQKYLGERKIDATVVFYGFSNERGPVASIPLPGLDEYTVISGKQRFEEATKTMYIGLGHQLRVDSYQWMVNGEELFGAIRKEIDDTLGKFAVKE